MKKRVVILSLLSMLVVFAIATAAFAQTKTYVIENGDEGYPVAVDEGPLALEGEGWAAGTKSYEGVDFFLFKAEPNATIPPHKSPDAWVSYVVKGFGELGLTDEDGNMKSVVRYRAGDIMAFGADTMHYWKNGSVESILIFVKKSAE